MTQTDSATVVPVKLKSSPPAVPPNRPSAPSGPAPLDISVQPRIGRRLVRGKRTEVPTGIVDVLIDGRLAAWTRTDQIRLIHAVAEVLPHEVPQVVAAVRDYLEENQNREFRQLPSVAPEQVEAIDSARRN